MQVPVSTEKTKAMYNKINATHYVECSAKFQQGVQDVFETAAKAALTKNRPSIIRNVIQCSILWNAMFQVTVPFNHPTTRKDYKKLTKSYMERYNKFDIYFLDVKSYQIPS